MRSGIAAVVDRLGAGLRRYGHDVDVVTSADVGRRHLGEWRLTGLVRHWPALRRRLPDYDVVHLHGPAPTFSDAFLALWRTVPAQQRPGLVYTHHSDIALDRLMPLCDAYNRMHRRLSRAASHVVVSTESYRTIAGGRQAHGVEVIPFAGDGGAAVAERRPGRMVVVFLGQLRPYKGADVLVRAAAQLPDLVVHIAGGGHQEARLRTLAAGLGADNVRFHGVVSDAERTALLGAADVIALPSRTRAEAFGLVLLEGMRAGAVPVASDLPGVRDVAGATGLLVQPGSVRSLVQALCHLRDDPADRRRRSLASVATAAEYTWDTTVRAYHRVLSDAALAGRLRSAPSWHVDGALALMREAALAERASLLLLDRKRERLRVVSVSGRPLPEGAHHAGADLDSFAGRALLAGEPYVVSTETEVLGRRYQPDAHAGLCVPFELRGEMQGVVSFTRHRALDFLPQEVSWMQRRVGHVAERVLETAQDAARVEDPGEAIA